MTSDPAIQTVADLEPQREVYYSSHRGGPQRRVHLDEDCRFLDKATNTFSGSAENLFGERQVCQDCLGSAEYGTEKGTDVKQTRRELSALDPTDLGLSPLGERRARTQTDGSGGGSA